MKFTQGFLVGFIVGVLFAGILVIYAAGGGSHERIAAADSQQLGR